MFLKIYETKINTANLKVEDGLINRLSSAFEIIKV